MTCRPLKRRIPLHGANMVSMEEVGFSISKRENADVTFRARPLIEFIQSSDCAIPGGRTDGCCRSRIRGQWPKPSTSSLMIDNEVCSCGFPDGGLTTLLEKTAPRQQIEGVAHGMRNEREESTSGREKEFSYEKEPTHPLL